MNIFVGNLPSSVNEAQLLRLFQPFGKISSVKIIMDFATEQSKGFGFVEMEEKEEANAAIKNLNSTNVMGNDIEVSEARPAAEKENAFLIAARNAKAAKSNTQQRRR